MKSGRDVIRARRAEGRKKVRFFKVTDLDHIRIGEAEIKEKWGEEHLKAKSAVCLKLIKEGKEFITDCWIAVGNGHLFADIYVTEDYKVIEILPFEEVMFVMDKEKRWEKENITYEAIVGDY